MLFEAAKMESTKLILIERTLNMSLYQIPSRFFAYWNILFIQIKKLCVSKQANSPDSAYSKIKK